MGAVISSVTTFLSVALCDGSSRKLIAGWWYVIEGMVAASFYGSVLGAAASTSISDNYLFVN